MARRVVRMAVEELGLADPQALVICNSRKDAYDFLGLRGRTLAIAQAVIISHRAENPTPVTPLAPAHAHRRRKRGSLLRHTTPPASPNKLMQVGRLRIGTNMPTTPRKHFRQDYFPEGVGPSGPFTIRPIADFEREDQQAGWITGPSGRRGARLANQRTRG